MICSIGVVLVADNELGTLFPFNAIGRDEMLEDAAVDVHAAVFEKANDVVLMAEAVADVVGDGSTPGICGRLGSRQVLNEVCGRLAVWVAFWTAHSPISRVWRIPIQREGGPHAYQVETDRSRDEIERIFCLPNSMYRNPPRNAASGKPWRRVSRVVPPPSFSLAKRRE